MIEIPKEACTTLSSLICSNHELPSQQQIGHIHTHRLLTENTDYLSVCTCHWYQTIQATEQAPW